MDKMPYVKLGNSGLKVSRLGFGNWANKAQNTREEFHALIKACFDGGINFFDTAELYDVGEAEVELGIALRALNVPREDYVVVTKLYWGKQPKNVNIQNVMGTSRKHIIEGLNRSLKHLGMEYVDVLFCHRFDHTTPVEELCAAMKTVIENGKCLYWGTSEWPASRIMEAIHICDKIGAPRPIAEQAHYNMLVRQKMESDYTVLFDDYKYGTTTYSALAAGVLTGKYNKGIPAGSRFDLHPDVLWWLKMYLDDEHKDETVKKLNLLDEVAKSIGATLPQLALAFVLTNQDVDVCILGATKLEQLKQNLQIWEVVAKFDKTVNDKVNAILKNAPDAGFDFITWNPMTPRRAIHFK